MTLWEFFSTSQEVLEDADGKGEAEDERTSEDLALRAYKLGLWDEDLLDEFASKAFLEAEPSSFKWGKKTQTHLL